MHTPGPWSYDGHGINCCAEAHLGERIFKTCLDYCHASPDRERAVADSYLVAAAPDLLAAAEEIDAVTAQCGLKMDAALQAAVDQLYNAIRKAKGVSQ